MLQTMAPPLTSPPRGSAKMVGTGCPTESRLPGPAYIFVGSYHRKAPGGLAGRHLSEGKASGGMPAHCQADVWRCLSSAAASSLCFVQLQELGSRVRDSGLRNVSAGGTPHLLPAQGTPGSEGFLVLPSRAAALFSGPCPSRGRCSCLVKDPAPAAGAHLPGRGARDWTLQHEDLDSYTLLKACGEAEPTFFPQHIKTH